MNKKTMALLVAGGLTLCGCSGEKKETTEKVVKVKTMTVETGRHSDGQSYSGTIEEQSGSVLNFSSVGTLQSIHVSEGQMVHKGQLIATIDEASVRSAYEGALAAKEQALDAEQRMKQLHDAGSLPEIKWIEVQTQVRQALSAEKIARKALTDTKLYAPFSGYVAQKQAEAGQSVAPGVPIVKLVRIDQVKVKISVPEDEIAPIRKSDRMQVRIAALGGRSFEAKVTEKGVAADALSRTYEVKGLISNPHHELLPGMIAEVMMGDTAQPAAIGQTIALPANIIQIDADNKTFVWTVAGGKAQQTYITTGDNIGDGVQITNGLKAGMKVICEGQQKVSNGMKVKE